MEARKGVQRVSNILAYWRALAHRPAHGEEEEETRVEALQGVVHQASQYTLAGIVDSRKGGPGIKGDEH